MVADEADRRHQDMTMTFLRQFTQRLFNRWTEPLLPGASLALIGKTRRLSPELHADRLGGSLYFLRIRILHGHHALGQTVGGKQDRHLCTHLGRESLQRPTNILDDGGDQQWMAMPTRHEADRSLTGEFSPRLLDLFHVGADAERRILRGHAQPDDAFR